MQHHFACQKIELMGKCELLQPHVHAEAIDVAIPMWEWLAIADQPRVVPQMDKRLLQAELLKGVLHSSVIC
ncbi:hypothetical protein D1178_06105 [Stenotrophomonas maltophilia]|nr:hypothetical protein D1178_06105 [Stenotrophomonas maltophilia]MBA0415590.1 hypothetical protein [Stenotrophomonas maltophilia]PZS91455.1 hypothetical protein A7X66_02065 [Stenotrophomonas maltophilia]